MIWQELNQEIRECQLYSKMHEAKRGRYRVNRVLSAEGLLKPIKVATFSCSDSSYVNCIIIAFHDSSERIEGSTLK